MDDVTEPDLSYNRAVMTVTRLRESSDFLHFRYEEPAEVELEGSYTASDLDALALMLRTNQTPAVSQVDERECPHCGYMRESNESQCEVCKQPPTHVKS